MKKKLLVLLLVSLFLVSIVNACVFPNKLELTYPMNVVALKSMKTDHSMLGENVLIEYDDFLLTVNENGAIITCKEVFIDCIDNSTFQSVLEDLEDWNAYDLSKEDKDTIANLYQPNIIIRKLENKDLIIVKFKGFVMSLFAKIFCVDYEEILTCENEWCSLETIKSEKCPAARC